MISIEESKTIDMATSAKEMSIRKVVNIGGSRPFKIDEGDYNIVQDLLDKNFIFGDDANSIIGVHENRLRSCRLYQRRLEIWPS